HGALEVLGRDERHLGHRQAPLLAAHDNVELGARLVQAVTHVAHGNVLAQRRARRPARHDTHLLALLGEDLGALAGWRTGHDEAHAAPVDALPALALDHELRRDRLGAVEARVRAPPLLGDDPRERRLHRRRRVVNVVTVQAHACLQTQAVACAEASKTQRLGPGRREQRLSEARRLVSGRLEADLEAVLARVPTAADHGLARKHDPLAALVLRAQASPHRLAKVHCRQVDALGRVNDLLQNLGALRALQRHEAEALEHLPPELAAFGLLQGGRVLGQVFKDLFARACVGDDAELRLLGARDHRVVDDATRTGPQEGAQLTRANLHVTHARRRYLLEEGGSLGTSEAVLDHVADVEETGVRAGEVVRLGEGQVGVLDGHVVAAKEDHLAAVGDVKVV
ncbi:hypothetical protein BN1723_001019, partial [Verticillium longisporum]